MPEWVTKGKTILIPKDPQKGTSPNNYRSIKYLLMMWKILIAQTRGDIFYSLINSGLFPVEQKGCHKRTRGIAVLLYIDQHILKENKTIWKKGCYGVDWLQKVIHMVLQSCIIDCLKMYKISEKVIKFIVEPWKTGKWNWLQEEKI